MGDTPQGPDIIKGWPEESQEAAQMVIDTYGEPQEATESLLTWHQVGPWKRVLASKVFFQHQFPAPHFDSVESVLDYRVPPEQFTVSRGLPAEAEERRACLPTVPLACHIGGSITVPSGQPRSLPRDP